MANVLTVQTETERPGVVTVEAISRDGARELSGNVVGFFVRRRRVGDRFRIARWEDFSPRWMKFVEQIPEGWEEKINAREKLLATGLTAARLEEDKPASERQAEFAQAVAKTLLGDLVALGQAGREVDAGSFNFATGKTSRPGKSESSAAK